MIGPSIILGLGARTRVGFIQPVSPGPDWNGTAGSGFVSVPTDPARTTAKPACRLLVPPNQRFTDTLVVGVMAFANNGGSLIDGIERVRFYFEGNTVDVMAPSVYSFNDANGSARSYWGYWVSLKKPASTAGEANLYVEAIPGDAAMQNRVIGPYQFSMETELHDYSVTVNSGGGADYTTLDAALEYLASEGADNPLVTITGGGPYQIAGLVGVAYTAAKNWCMVTASVPVTFSRASFIGDVASDFRPKYHRVRFRGENITFDLRHVRHLRAEAGDTMWLDGCRIINSDTRGAWRGAQRLLSASVSGSPYFTETIFDGVANPCNLAELARGVQGTRLLGDFAGDGRCVVYCDVDDLSGADGWLEDIPALEVTYTGAEATATLAKAGGANALQTFTATYGANTATFQVRNTEAFYDFALDPGYDATTDGQGYFVQDVADWLNSLPGWSATVLDNTRAAYSLSLPTLRGLAFGARNVKDVTLEMVRCFDIHGDFFQHRFNGVEENVIVAFNKATNMAGQMMFVSSTSPARDFYFVNNAFSNVPSTAGPYLNWKQVSSQCNRGPHKHVVFAHNSLPTQRLLLRADGADGALYTNDTYCLISNNAFHNLRYIGTPIAQHLNVVIKDNVIDAEFVTGPANATGTVVAGDYTTKFVDSVAGDFTPAGVLTGNLFAPVVRVDLNNQRRGGTAPAGAIA